MIPLKIEDFLEKNDIREVTVFKQLVLNGGELSYADMLEYLAVTRASLDKDLTSITFRTQSLSEQVRVDYDGQTISLFMSDDFSLQHIYQLYLKQSVKVNIIDYLFHHQEFTIIQLAETLALSESSLFRKIKELNGYLKEFGIKIRNGQLHGEELQIRYFYYQFYWYVADKSGTAPHQNDSQLAQMVHGMENFLHITLSEENKHRLAVWFLISKQRVLCKKKTYKNLRQKMQPYLEDGMYQNIRSMVLRYFSRYSIEVDEEEAMLHFVFLLAFPILSEPDFHEYSLLRDRRTPTATLDTYIVETIIIHYKFRKLPYMLERELVYYLSQIHTKMYFLEGDIEVYEYEALLEKEKEFTGQDLVTLASRLQTISLSKLGLEDQKRNTLVKMELLKFISLLAIVTFEMMSVVHIAIDLKMDNLYAEALIQLLMQKIRHVNGTQIEKFDPERSYDLIITNAPITQTDRYGKAKVYVLSEILSAFDMKNIEKMIQQLNQ